MKSSNSLPVATAVDNASTPDACTRFDWCDSRYHWTPEEAHFEAIESEMHTTSKESFFGECIEAFITKRLDGKPAFLYLDFEGYAEQHMEDVAADLEEARRFADALSRLAQQVERINAASDAEQ